MKHTKHFLLLLVFMATATCAFAQAVGSGFTVNEIVYTITNNDLVHHTDNRVAVSYIGGSGAVTVPSTVKHPQSDETYKVTESMGWTDCSKTITSLTFSEGYEKMGNGCYRFADGVTKVILPKSFKEIGHSCFENCPAFTRYEVKSGNNDFTHNSKGWLLSKNQKTLVSFPSGIAGDVDIDEGITTLATTAFKVCRKVNKVKLPKSLTTIDESMNASFYAVGSSFEVHSGNQAFKAVNGVLCSRDGKRLIAFPPRYDKNKLSNGKYTLPIAVEQVGSQAFCQTEDYLKTVDLKNAKTIKEEAFNWTNGLESVHIGRQVNNIVPGAFLYCSKLVKFTVSDNNGTYSAQDDMIYSKNKTKLVVCPTGKRGEYTIHNGTVSVENKAFYGSKLTKITFPSSLKSVGRESFRFSQIAAIDFGTNPGLETIMNSAFSGSKLAGTITIPASVKEMQGRVFYDTKIAHIRIASGSKLEKIEQLGFDGMPELKTFVFQGTNSVKSIGENAFADDPKLESFEIPSGVTDIYKGAFVNTPALKTVTFKQPASIKVIGEGAFGNSGITAITLPASVTTIKKQAFDNCKELQTITIPKNVTKIETGAFNFTEKMKKFEVDAANTKYSAVDGILCSNNKDTLVTFPAGKADSRYTSLPYFKAIGPYAFYSSKKVTNVTIPRSVTEIKTRAFALCDNLTSLSFMGTDNVPTLKAGILFSSPNPKKVTIYVRKKWYEASANEATVRNYRNTFKEVHPSFVSAKGYDRGVEFFPTSDGAVGVVSFYTPRTSAIIGTHATESEYTDKFGMHWPTKTYEVAAVLDHAFEASTPNVKMITVLADINNIGLDAFKAPTLKELYFVGDVPAPLSSTIYNLPANYPFNNNVDLKVYVKQSKLQDYKTAWNVSGHTLSLGWQIPAKTLGKRASACYPFDVVYNTVADLKPYLTLKLDENLTQSHLHDGTAYVWSRSVDDFTVPAYQPVLLVSKGTTSVTSWCQMKEVQDHPAIDKTGYTDYMLGTVEDTELKNEGGYTLFGLSKSGVFKKVATAGNHVTWFKAYLKIANSAIPAGAKSIVFLIEGESLPTGIDGPTTAEAADGDAAYYNLNGAHVEQPQRGIYIRNGRKIVIK